MNSGSCSRENGLHQFLEPVTLCWIKEAREQNSTTLENALLRFGVSFGVRINSCSSIWGKMDNPLASAMHQVSFLDLRPQGFYERSLGFFSWYAI